MSESIGVGIIGLGRSGWDIHVATLKDNPQFHVVAVVDSDAARCEEATALLGCAAYETADELINDAAVELVVVATPSHTHGALSVAALQAGKDVLVEKPMAQNAAEADTMICQAEKSGKMLAVYQPRRVATDFLKVREILESGVLGPIHLIKLSVYGYNRRRDWQTLKKFAGGILNNHGAHYIDQVLALAGGQWSDLFVDMRHLVSAGDAEDHAKILFRGGSGAVVDVELSMVAAAPNPPHWTVLGRYGALSGTRTHFEWRFYDPTQVPPREIRDGDPNREYEAPEDLPWQECSADVEDTDLAIDFYNQLFAALREGGPSPAPPSELRALTALFDECRKRSELY